MEPSVLLFDGVCNLCSRLVRFVLDRDREERFRFASLQSETGRRYLAEHGLPEDLDTMVLIEGGRAYVRSTAALRTARRLGLPWRLLYPLVLIPPFLRDPAYRLLARNRYRWFGKSDVCSIPTPDERARFLSDADLSGSRNDAESPDLRGAGRST